MTNTQYDDMTVAQLVSLARERGLKVTSKTRKPALIELHTAEDDDAVALAELLDSETEPVVRSYVDDELPAKGAAEPLTHIQKFERYAAAAGRSIFTYRPTPRQARRIRKAAFKQYDTKDYAVICGV